MAWVAWGCALAAVVATTSLAIFWYLAWSFRWEIRRLNVGAEASFLAGIVLWGATAIAWVVAHHP